MNNKKVILDDGRIGWLSRSVACATMICKIEDNKKYVLCIKRGENVNETGKWSIPCGFLDYDETLEQCAIRELYEETSFDFRSKSNDVFKLRLVYIHDKPIADQNVTMFYRMDFSPKGTNDIEVKRMLNYNGGAPSFDTNGEILEIKWICEDDFSNYEWAFQTDKFIKLSLN